MVVVTAVVAVVDGARCIGREGYDEGGGRGGG